MDPNLIGKMRARILQCRRLADLTHDREIERQLLEMAEEGEADVTRLEAGDPISDESIEPQ